MQTLGIIESYYPSFTKSEKRIADFIIESNSKVIDLTLSELAVMLNVGEATIVRFCRKMKLKGFQELKFLLAIDDDGKQQETDKHECIKNNLIQTIQITDSMIQQEEINHAIQLIEEAEYIYFFGIGTSGLAASMGESRLFRFGKQTKAVTDSHRQLMQASLCNDGKVNLMNAGTFSSMVSQLFILDLLTSGYGLHNAGSVRIARENIARVIYGKTRDES